MMAIKLSKGQKIDLTKNNPLLNRVMVGLGWTAGQGIDLDTAAFLLRSDGKVASDEDFVFYGNLRHKSGSVEHSGDSKSGGAGDVEQIHVDLSRVPNDVDRIDFTATIYDAKTRRQNFGQVKDAYIRVVDESSGQELIRFNLGDQFSVETAIVVGEIYRHKGNWKFNAIGAGFSGGLAALCKNFGVDVSEDDSSTNQPPSPPPQPKRESKPAAPPKVKREPSTSTGGALNMGRGRSDDRQSDRTAGGGFNMGRGRRDDRSDGGTSGSPSPLNLGRGASGGSSSKSTAPLNLGRGGSFNDTANDTPNQVNPSKPPSDYQDRPKKIELRKGQKVSLVKSERGFGEIVINLNWSQPPRRESSKSIIDRFFSDRGKPITLDNLFRSGDSNSGIDLDLGCLYELKNGDKGAIQALGKNFGTLDAPPYIALDGDDRTGSNAAGETIRVNGRHADKIKRILVYTFIYEGVANWREADGVVTVKCAGSPDIIVRMDEYGSDKMLCGIALIENIGTTFSVEKVVEFFDSQSYLDKAFNWGLRWSVGRK